MTKIYGMSAEALLQRYEPRSESRPDIVERDEEMLRRIRARRRDYFIFCALMAVFVVLPLVTLAMQNASMTDEQRETVEHIFH